MAAIWCAASATEMQPVSAIGDDMDSEQGEKASGSSGANQLTNTRATEICLAVCLCTCF